MNVPAACQTSSVMAQQALSPNCSSWTEAHSTVAATIACLSQDQFQAVSYMSTPFAVPIFSTFVSSIEYGNTAFYPFVLRVGSTELGQAKATVALLKKFGWSRVGVMYRETAFQRAAALTYITTFDSNNIQVISAPYRDTTGDALTASIQQALRILQSNDIRIICIIGGIEVLKPAATMGMVGPNSGIQWVGISFMMGRIYPMLLAASDRWMLRGLVGAMAYNPRGPDFDNFASSNRFIINGSDPFLTAPGIAFAYDSIAAIVQAVKSLLVDKNRGNFTSAELFNEITYLNFTGLGLDQFTIDRSINAKESQFDIANYDASEGLVYKTVGSYYATTGLTLSTVTFSNGLTQPPFDRPQRKLITLAPEDQNGIFAIFAVLCVVNLVFHIVVLCFREHKVIRASSPLFCHLMLLGSTCAYVAIMLKSADLQTNTKALCQLVPLFLGLAFSLIIGSLLMKTWRIAKIFNNPDLRIVAIENRNLVGVILVFLLVEGICHIIWYAVDAPKVSLRVDPLDKYADFYACQMQYSMAWWLLLLLPKIVALIYGCLLAYQVRNVNADFNEAKFIAMTIYNTMILGLLVVGLLVLLDDQLRNQYLTFCVGVALVSFNNNLILFLPKFYQIYVDNSPDGTTMLRGSSKIGVSEMPPRSTDYVSPKSANRKSSTASS
eukprot:TRINITY_DN4746_c0_g1_i3.p1 TRINITY_DN4746_c0_g1~~TRINITY_DN4746_c0_g1_i3.p1  ORF type:complete len:702 (-),score=115.84 TRINITY_DN4746_c0_g1_i3:115-2109(-)